MLGRAHPHVAVLGHSRHDDERGDCGDAPGDAPPERDKHEQHEGREAADKDEMGPECEAGCRHRSVEPSGPACLVPPEQRQHRGCRQRRGQRVDFREDRVLPERASQAHRTGDGRRDQGVDAQASHGEEDECAGGGAPDRREHIDAIGKGPDRYARPCVREQDVQRIARVVGRAQHRADVLEFRGVFGAAEAGQEGCEIDGEEQEKHDGGHGAVDSNPAPVRPAAGPFPCAAIMPP